MLPESWSQTLQISFNLNMASTLIIWRLIAFDPAHCIYWTLLQFIVANEVVQYVLSYSGSLVDCVWERGGWVWVTQWHDVFCLSLPITKILLRSEWVCSCTAWTNKESLPLTCVHSKVSRTCVLLCWKACSLRKKCVDPLWVQQDMK